MSSTSLIGWRTFSVAGLERQCLLIEADDIAGELLAAQRLHVGGKSEDGQEQD